MLAEADDCIQGIRLVIEALAGGDFAELIDADRVAEALSACPGDADAFCEKARRMLQLTTPTHSENASEDEYNDGDGPGVHFTPADKVFTGNKEPPVKSLSDKVAQVFKLAEDKLKESRPIIVGHNQFMDLLFLYNTFIDDLPDTLPDTLDDFLLSDCKAMPQITWNTAYGYGRGGTAHEAGFDSFMTATVFLGLAYKPARKNLPSDDDEEAGRTLRSFYSREWLSAIGRNPDYFEDQRSSRPCWSEPSDVDREVVSQPEWGDPVFDLVENTIRIAPHKTTYIGDEAWISQLRMSGWRKLLRISQKGRVKRENASYVK
ncbi:hypothetical protein LZ31DRAFT_593922 [Colletotrichum somersetense]|nr:hypothetical protein LZ31DRAFT_593922 [Colletotrichum somersetense]